jgi:glycine cleavage system H protein
MYPEELYYSEEHEWVKKEKNHIVTIGITEYAQKELGEIVYVELPELSTEVEVNDTACEIESVKSVSPIYSPLSGKITEVNSELENQPDLINSSPYEDGWLYKMHILDDDEFGNLLSADEYKKHISNL